AGPSCFGGFKETRCPRCQRSFGLALSPFPPGQCATVHRKLPGQGLSEKCPGACGNTRRSVSRPSSAAEAMDFAAQDANIAQDQLELAFFVSASMFGEVSGSPRVVTRGHPASVSL